MVSKSCIPVWPEGVAQCRLLNIARSALYYRPAPVNPDNLAVMRRMEQLHPAPGDKYQRKIRNEIRNRLRKR